MNDTLPLISIITVCKNDAVRLQKTAANIVGQTYPNIEWIIIDCLSTDETPTVIKDYQNQITCVIREEDTGIYDAMNKGIAVAKGDWLHFLNAGDYYLHEEVLEQVSHYFNPQYAFVYSDIYLLNQKGEKHYKKQRPLFQFGLFTNICHQSVFFNKLKLKNYQYNLVYKISADTDLLLKLYTKYKKWAYQQIPHPFIIYEQGGFSDKHLKEALLERKQQFKEYLAGNWRYYINVSNLNRQLLCISFSM